MKSEKIPYPKRYWVYLAICVLSTVMLFVNIFWAAAATEKREISEFTKTDWEYFRRFLAAEGISLFFAFFFAGKVGKIGSIRREKIQQLKNLNYQMLYQGIRLKKYDDVYFDSTKRAVISEESNYFLLDVQEFDEEENDWKPVDAVRGYPSEVELWTALYQKLGFSAEDNVEEETSDNEI